jgi:distribution and morphology protein 34
LTIVFRNDPLESLKVSSTFDSIQFVRDYLQRTIEGKLRDLMMDELPAIIHRLSLQLWCPDQIAKEDDEPKEADERGVNPLATPPLDAVDAHGHILDPAAIAELSLDGGPEAQLLFSQRTLYRFSDLTKSQITSSLDTSAPRDILVRAWAGLSDKADASSTPPLATPSLARTSSYTNAHTYAFSDSGSQDSGSLPSRPSMVHLNSTAGLWLGSGRHSKAGRKKKTRVVNLRRKAGTEVSSEQGDDTSETASTAAPMSEPVMPHPILEVPEDEPSTSKVRFSRSPDLQSQQQQQQIRRPSMRAAENPRLPDMAIPSVDIRAPAPAAAAQPSEKHLSSHEATTTSTKDAAGAAPVDSKAEWRRSRPMSDTSSVILEQAWIMKMAGEIARRVYDEKNRNPSFWDDRDDSPPPAYEAR